MTDPNWPDIAGRRTEFGHVLAVRVYFEDTDFSGRVYHANYLRFMERGRSDFLRHFGILHDKLDKRATGRAAFAVRNMNVDFLRPAGMDALLEVETRLGSVQGARIVLKQRIVSRGEVLVTAELTVVLIDEAGKPRRIPVDIRERLAAAGEGASWRRI